MPRGIDIINRTIVAIGKHIATQDALAGGDVDIGIDESTYRSIVISALQVIEACFLSGKLAIQSNFAPCGDSKMYSLQSVNLAKLSPRHHLLRRLQPDYKGSVTLWKSELNGMLFFLANTQFRSKVSFR